MIASILTTLSDAELLDLVRRGDETAFTALYSRHREVAVRMAAAYCRSGEADDLADLAFEKVLGALRRGRGPTGAFRAYIFVTLRRLAAEQAERPQESLLEDLPEPLVTLAAAPQLDPAEREMITTAFESLPDRWQAVLWHTAVEGRHPRDLASVLGMTANAVSALAYRAREKLRQAYLQAHLRVAPHPECEPYRSSLGAYVREGQSPRERRATAEHLEHCRSCQALVAELLDVNRLLARSVIPFFLVGSAGKWGSAAVASVGADGAAHMARRSLWGWSRLHHLGTLAGGVAATTALLVGLAELRPQTGGPGPGVARPDAGITIVDGPTGGEQLDARAASSVTPCVPGATAARTPSGDAEGGTTTTTAAPGLVSTLVAQVDEAVTEATTPPTTTAPATAPAQGSEPAVDLTEVSCTATEPGKGDLTVVVSRADVATTESPADPGDALPVDTEVTVDLSDGVRITVGAGLPGGCEVADDRRSLTCTLETLAPGAPTEATVGLEVEAESGQLPEATVTLTNETETIVSETVDLSAVADLITLSD